MNILLDTNILNRLQDPSHPMYPDARNSIRVLSRTGHKLCVAPQNLYEFWVVCTRPQGVNGLGKSAAEATAELTKIRAMFDFYDDTSSLFSSWESLVTTYAVVGKNAHDARLVATMQVHGITHLLTFNDKDFRRFTTITVLTPAGVVAAPPPP